MSERFNQLLDREIIWELLDPNAVVYLTLVLIIFYVGKKAYDLLTPYDLNYELLEADNKAVAVSLSGYLFGLGIILWGVLGDSPEKLMASKSAFYMDLMDTAVWGGIGIVLLQIARIINDKLILNRFDNIKEIVKDRNIGTGAVQCGAFIGSALMIRASLIGGDENYLTSIGFALIFFVLGQLGFFVYTKFYQFVTSYDIHEEIEKDNVAAGVAFGMSLIAVGVLISGYIVKHDSILGLGIWFILGTFLLLIVRLLVDKIILPGRLLDNEIKQDQNWGAAIIEGSAAIIFAFVLNTAF